MIEKFFTCTLNSDIVLNSKLETEGNMTTLDYIPGSNFLGVVAAALYKESNNENFELFHSGKVSFGDGFLTDCNGVSHAFPLSFYLDKNEMELKKETVFVHHDIEFDKIGKEIQLKQVRNGYFSYQNDIYVMPKAKKTFALKSAQDSEKRRSLDENMFGLESLSKNQQFLFSVLFENETYIEKVSFALCGEKRIGKSKSAEFGQVLIKELKNTQTSKNGIDASGYVLVYAQSNLCFLNGYGQSTFQPNANDLGISEGEIIWEKSQIRTYSYSPWNFKRNSTNTQRDCILKGSVFYVKLNENISLPNSKIIGEYAAEGLGRVLYNPSFLEAEKGKTIFNFNKITNNRTPKTNTNYTTDLGNFLLKKKNQKMVDLETSLAIQTSKFEAKGITNSQWGNIRNFATQYNHEQLFGKLFDPITGYLCIGVAAEKYWNKNNGAARKELKEILEKNSKYGSNFAVKFASEMAKKQKDK